MATQQAIKEVALVPVADEPKDIASQIIALAANEQMDVAKLEKLIDMQERVMRWQAEAAFNQAFAVMQGEMPTVVEKAKGDKNMMYAPLEDIIEAVRPILVKHQFSLSHRTEWPEKGVVKVVGVLSHALGHKRESEFQSAADNSGSKNAVQALGSAMTYGRRYTTNDLLGIVTRKEDDDGARSSTAEVTDPDGYDDWRMDLELIAQEKGLAALTVAWKKSSEAFRSHTFKHYRKAWEVTKAAAAKARAV